MLRITHSGYMQVVAVHLHGKLVGPWVEELRQTVARLGRDAAIRLNLEHLSFADAAGLALLCQLRREGVDLVRVQPLIEGLLASQARADCAPPHEVEHA